MAAAKPKAQTPAKRPTFDSSCVYLSADDKSALWAMLERALRLAKKAPTPWTDQRRVYVGRLMHLLREIERRARDEESTE
jgi:hypothetical protein